jgi:TraR antiactivator
MEDDVSNNKVVLTPLIGLMNGRSLEEVERHTVEQIKKHRRFRDEASLLDAKLSALGEGDDREGVEHEYVAALIAMHAQQTVVSTLLDILGYIPDVPGPKPN